MSENKDAAIEDLLKNVSTEELISLLRARNLTPGNVAVLQSLRPAETTSGSQTTIATGGPKEIKSSAERFAKAVIRKNAHGKLPVGSKINGVEIDRFKEGGFYDHGPDKKMQPSPLGEKVSQLNSTIYKNQRELPDLVNTHIVSVTPSEQDKGNMILTIHFFQDKKQIDGRGWCTPGHVSTELPSGIMTEFLGEISKNPDLLEDFYQKSFVGLDSQDGSPGMRRTKSDGFYLISGSKLEEVGKIASDNTRSVNNFFATLEKHHYQQGPHGTGDTFQPTQF